MQINVGHLTEGISGHDGQVLGVIKNLVDSGKNINVTDYFSFEDIYDKK